MSSMLTSNRHSYLPVRIIINPSVGGGAICRLLLEKIENACVSPQHEYLN